MVAGSTEPTVSGRRRRAQDERRTDEKDRPGVHDGGRFHATVLRTNGQAPSRDRQTVFGLRRASVERQRRGRLRSHSEVSTGPTPDGAHCDGSGRPSGPRGVRHFGPGAGRRQRRLLRKEASILPTDFFHNRPRGKVENRQRLLQDGRRKFQITTDILFVCLYNKIIQ